MEYTLRSTAVVPASPDQVFAVITDIERLPDWNIEIPRVVESPALLDVGTEWVVTIHAMKTHWNSRARAVEVDTERYRFAYRSQSDDGNPSHADWRWQLVPGPSGHGTEVTVEVDVHPRTFMRKWILSGLRRPSLRRAIDRSLLALREQVSVR